jgi:DNA-binding MurR/RpiR family transcriptional regulator
MININFSILNPLEQQIHAKLLEHSKKKTNIKITEAATICDCSVSKISKFTKKLGFSNYKQYMDFLYGREIASTQQSDELKRIQSFIDDFSEDKVNELMSLIEQHDKIVLFGYGPSLICAQYFEYRLRTCTNKPIIAVADEISVASMTNESTLLILLTVTGRFHTFENIYKASKEKGCEVVIVVEEYNAELFHQCDKIFWLCQYPQPENLLPYEKSRTVFFLFLEEVIQKLIKKHKSASGNRL